MIARNHHLLKAPSARFCIAGICSAQPGHAVPPAIGIGHLFYGPPFHRAELVFRIADGHERIGEHIVGYPQQSLDLALATDVISGNQRTETESPASKNDILHGGVNAGAANSVCVDNLLLINRLHRGRQRLSRRWRPISETRHQEYWRVSYVLPQIRSG